MEKEIKEINKRFDLVFDFAKVVQSSINEITEYLREAYKAIQDNTEMIEELSTRLKTDVSIQSGLNEHLEERIALLEARLNVREFVSTETKECNKRCQTSK